MQGALGCRLLTFIIVFKYMYHVSRGHLVEELLLFFKYHVSKGHLVVDYLLLFLSTM